jgi:hypothetical protein
VAVNGSGVLVAVGSGVALLVGSGEVGLGSDVTLIFVAVGTVVASDVGGRVRSAGVAVGAGELSTNRGLTPMTPRKIRAIIKAKTARTKFT